MLTALDGIYSAVSVVKCLDIVDPLCRSIGKEPPYRRTVLSLRNRPHVPRRRILGHVVEEVRRSPSFGNRRGRGVDYEQGHGRRFVTTTRPAEEARSDDERTSHGYRARGGGTTVEGVRTESSN